MFEQTTDKKCALLLADGSEEVEALTVYDILFRAGIPVATVSVKPEPLITSSHGVTIVTDTTADAVNFEDYHALILPGGMPGTTNLKACAPLCDALVHFAAEGKLIAAICAAPTIPASLGLMKGLEATCYPAPAFTQVLTENGVHYTERSVVESGSFITSRGVGTAIDFALAIAEKLVGRAVADSVASAIVYGRG